MAGLGVTNQNSLTPQGPALTTENVLRYLVAPLAEQSVFLSSGVQIIDSASPVRMPTAPDPNENLGYVGEGGTIPVVVPQFGKVNLLPSTMQSIKVLSKFSNELYRQSVIAIDLALQEHLVNSVAATLDTQLIAGSGDGVTTIKGLLNFDNTQTLAVGGALTVDKIYDAIALSRKAFIGNEDLRLWVTPDVENQLRKLKTTDGAYLLQPGTAGTPASVAGVPLTVTQRIPTTGTTTKATQAVLWAPRFVTVVRDAAPTVTFLKELFAATDEFGIRVTSRYDVGVAKPQSIVKLTGISV